MADEAIPFRRIERKEVKRPQIGIYIDDELDQVEISGTSEGIQDLIDHLTRLKANFPAQEFAHLKPGEGRLTNDSASLVFELVEASEFFPEDQGALEEEPWPHRDIDPKELYVIQFVGDVPEDLPIEPERLYPVLRTYPRDVPRVETKQFPPGRPERYCCVEFLGEEGAKLRYVVHLDDPDINFFSRKEIMPLVIRPAPQKG